MPPDDIKASKISEGAYFTTMSHVYRGELGRAMVWRERLDNTTNWAVLAAVGVITFALGSEEISHIVFMLANMAVLILLVIEGRRYRYYDAYRSRVRILEAHLLVPVIMRSDKQLQGDWRKLLAEDMLIPSYKISAAEAVGKRLNKNHRWIFLVILVSLVLKIFMHYPDTNTVAGFLRAMNYGQPLHPAVYWSFFAAFYGSMIYLMFQGRHAGGMHDEFPRRTPRPGGWTL